MQGPAIACYNASLHGDFVDCTSGAASVKRDFVSCDFVDIFDNIDFTTVLDQSKNLLVEWFEPYFKGQEPDPKVQNAGHIPHAFPGIWAMSATNKPLV